MERTQTEHGLLEDLLLASKGNGSWTTFHGGGDYQIFPSNCNYDLFDHEQDFATSISSASGLATSIEPETGYAFPFCDHNSFLDELTLASEFDSSFDHGKYYHGLPPIPIQEEHERMVENVHVGLSGQSVHGFKDGKDFCKVEMEIKPMANMDASTSATALCGKRKSEVKKVDRKPSKNLMAERRRRKRLNDRLSMLRSIVPKISKMDRTSILGGTIDYIKDLLDKIHKLREENMEENTNLMNIMGNLKEQKPEEVLGSNSPKFDVERRNVDTRIELRCSSNPGLLLSTVSTLEEFGLDIQQCVISCFNDFSVRATCSEVREHRRIVGSEDVKQALFRNAGYGGRCL